MKIILYSIGCPKCNVLKKKLEQRGIEFIYIDDEKEFETQGFSSAPMLVIEDDDKTVRTLTFSEAVEWLKQQ